MLDILFFLLIFVDDVTPSFVPQRGHTEAITCVAFSSNGKLLASAGSDKLIFLWEIDSGRLVKTMPAGEGRVIRLAFGHEDKHLYASDSKGILREFDVYGLGVEVLFKSEKPTVLDFDLHKNRIIVYSGVSFQTSNDHNLESMMYSTKSRANNWKNLGSKFVKGSYQAEASIMEQFQWEEFYDIVPFSINLENREIKNLNFERVPTGRIRFDPEGKHVISSASGNAVVLWDIETCRAIWRIEVANSRLINACFSPDRKMVACSIYVDPELFRYKEGGETYRNGMMYYLRRNKNDVAKYITLILNAETGETLCDLSGYSKAVSSIFWLNNESVVTGTYSQLSVPAIYDPEHYKYFGLETDDELSKWSISTEKRTILCKSSSFVDLGYDPLKKIISFPQNVIDEGGQILHIPAILNIEGSTNLRNFGQIVKPVTKICLSQDEKIFATIQKDDNLIYLWDLNATQKLHTLTGHDAPVNAIAFSPTYVLASAGDDSVVRLWDSRARKLLRTLQGHKYPVTDIVFVAGGKEIIGASFDPEDEDGGRLIKWDVETGRRLPDFEKKGIPREFPMIENLLYSDLGYLILKHKNGNWPSMVYDRVRSWDLKGGKWGKLKSHWGEGQGSFALSSDGQTLFTTSADKLIFQSVSTGKIIKEIKQENSHIHTASFLDDGTVLTGDRQGIKHWSMQNQEYIFAYNKGHELAENFAVFSNGTTVLSAEQGGLLKLWDLKDKDKMVIIVAIAGRQEYLMYSPAGIYMGTPGGRRAVTVVYDNFRTGSLHQVKHLNRPDLILEQFPQISQFVLENHRQLVLKRGVLGTETQLVLPKLDLTNRNDMPYFTKDHQVSLAYDAEPGTYPLDSVTIWADGVPQVKTKAPKGIRQVALGSGPNLIEIAAVDVNGNESARHQVLVETPSENVIQDLYLVTLGVSDYQGESKDLTYAAKDARDVVTFFSKGKFGYNKVHIMSLFDGDVSFGRLRDIRSFLEQGNVDDQVLVFLSGHGNLVGRRFYFAAGDTDFSAPDKHGIPFEKLDELLDGLPQRRKLLIMDACYTGRLDPEAEMSTTNDNKVGSKGNSWEFESKDGDLFHLGEDLFSDLEVNSGATVFAASEGMQWAREASELGNGVFTYSFLRGLRTGHADLNRDGLFRMSELMRYTLQKVADLTNDVQKPDFRAANLLMDFPLFPSKMSAPIEKRMLNTKGKRNIWSALTKEMEKIIFNFYGHAEVPHVVLILRGGFSEK